MNQMKNKMFKSFLKSNLKIQQTALCASFIQLILRHFKQCFAFLSTLQGSLIKASSRVGSAVMSILFKQAFVSNEDCTHLHKLNINLQASGMQIASEPAEP